MIDLDENLIISFEYISVHEIKDYLLVPGEKGDYGIDSITVASVYEFNSEWFYIEMSGYSPYIFDFDFLSVSSDILPVMN